jgi:hypothetical protein
MAALTRFEEAPMSTAARNNPKVWLVIGLLLGLLIGSHWPQAPLHAWSATAQTEKFAIATGSIDDASEGLFILDYLTGELQCAVISPATGAFMSFFKTNIVSDLRVDAAKNPKFLMVTGNLDFRRVAGGPQLGTCVCYVAEASSGQVVAYGVPWARQRQNATDYFSAPLMKLDDFKFREVTVREP